MPWAPHGLQLRPGKGRNVGQWDEDGQAGNQQEQTNFAPEIRKPSKRWKSHGMRVTKKSNTTTHAIDKVI